ncbi:UPF0149 family protein [Piscirickettsia litoralis]|uniref:YecA family protein n=1 Tax=Piscirickettsia litoralis TaxID=1891921 RepID=A0ABX3A1I5_9GAMM|nr:UPF0149 family protein [Piscirickettsia litoralis]ODN42739.1 hypothetical protein BGC07_07140 [Piscirickettsia litoralis]
MSQTLIEFEKIENALNTLGIEGMSAADVHGLLVGMLAGQEKLTCKFWLEKAILASIESDSKSDLFANVMAKEPVKQLEQLFKVSWEQMYAGDFEFSLLLPDDSADLAERASLLCAWTQGFLTGLHLSGVNIAKYKEGELAATLKDLTEIAQLDLAIEDNEENETAYTEIAEYVRMAALFIHSELTGSDRPAVH